MYQKFMEKERLIQVKEQMEEQNIWTLEALEENQRLYEEFLGAMYLFSGAIIKSYLKDICKELHAQNLDEENIVYQKVADIAYGTKKKKPNTGERYLVNYITCDDAQKLPSYVANALRNACLDALKKKRLKTVSYDVLVELHCEYRERKKA